MATGSREVRRVAIVTEPAHPGLNVDDVGLPSAFAARGVEIEPIAWGGAIPRERFDLALVRTPWDYFLRADEFLAWIDALEVPVVNPPEVLRWNHDKRYLLELEGAGVARLPGTLKLGPGERPQRADEVLDRLGAERAVLKPVVSAGAYRTRVIERGGGIEWSEEEGRGVFLAQEFVEAIERRGEWSLMFFGGEYSHAVRKTAKAGDFRVQEEYGGGVHVERPGAEVVEAASRVLGGVPVGGRGGELVYARVDLVEGSGGEVLLMELELIEPELFLRVEERAAERLVGAVLGVGAGG